MIYGLFYSGIDKNSVPQAHDAFSGLICCLEYFQFWYFMFKIDGTDSIRYASRVWDCMGSIIIKSDTMTAIWERF